MRLKFNRRVGYEQFLFDPIIPIGTSDVSTSTRNVDESAISCLASLGSLVDPTLSRSHEGGKPFIVSSGWMNQVVCQKGGGGGKGRCESRSEIHRESETRVGEREG